MTNTVAGVAALHKIALYVQRHVSRDLYVLALDVALQPLLPLHMSHTAYVSLYATNTASTCVLLCATNTGDEYIWITIYVQRCKHSDTYVFALDIALQPLIPPYSTHTYVSLYTTYTAHTYVSLYATNTANT